jgi:hypothetical protein
MRRGAGFRDLVISNRERQIENPFLGWIWSGTGFEHNFPLTPQERSSPKKFHRFHCSPSFGRSGKRSRREVRTRSCLEVDPELFHEYASPSGPVCIELEELARIMAEKKTLKKLSERRIPSGSQEEVH